MKNICIILLVLLSASLFAQSDTIIVHDKNDKRLKSYNDSMACYQYGWWQAYYAKTLKDRMDTYWGRIYENKVERKRKELGLPHAYSMVDDGSLEVATKDISIDCKGWKIKPIKIEERYRILIRATWSAEEGATTWTTSQYVWKKPTQPVVFSQLIHNTELPLTTIKKDTVIKSDTTTFTPKIVGVYIQMPDGSKLSKEEYISKYSKENYDKLFTQKP